MGRCFVYSARESESAPALVFAQYGRTEDFGKLATHRSPQQIHLPQAIARGDIALRKIEVVVVGGFEVGNAAFIAPHDSAIAQTWQSNGVVSLLCDSGQ